MSDAPAPAPSIRRDGTVLGFDVGARRIGVAVGSAFGHGARRVLQHIDQGLLDSS